ncbi:MAG TPA: pseudouridine synthase [Patescibacteria group bacterium]|nr:pseudouridine synthase [Patescibacteria group bacterium]
MRINKYVAQATGLSRRHIDNLISQNKILINDSPAKLGQDVKAIDEIKINEKVIKLTNNKVLVILNKKADYVCSRQGQGSKTIYDLLPHKYKDLKSVGRLDKDSSGLLLMTNDGDLANKLSHPKYQKTKIYHLKLNREVTDLDLHKINKGIQLTDGVSQIKVKRIPSKTYDVQVEMSEGRNRQIRRTFQKLNYKVIKLHRVAFGEYRLNDIKLGEYKEIKITD